MKLRRKTSEDPLSLFCFQDIITCVTGIMILVVLLFVVQLIQKQTEAVFQDSENYEQIEHLRNKLARLDKEKKELKQWLSNSQEEIMQTLKISPANIPKEIDTQKKQIQHLKKRIATLEPQREKYKESVNSLSQEIGQKKEKLEKLRHNNQSSAEKLEKLEKSLENKRKELDEKKQRAEHLVKLKVTAEQQKTPILLQCSDSKINVKPANENSSTISYRGQNTVALLEKLKLYLETRNPREEYILVLLKPSAAGYGGLLRGVLEDTNFVYGIEAFAEEWEGVL